MDSKYVYKAILDIAIMLQKNNKTITARELYQVLNMLGYKTSEETPFKENQTRARVISEAWKYTLIHIDKIQTNHPNADAIATSFTRNDGKTYKWE